MKFSSLRLAALCLCVSMVAGASAYAQEHNYWTDQFGTRSALLGGAVVGGVRDTSATFYNPGALGLIRNPSLSVSANALKYEALSLENGAGTNDDLDSDSLRVVPLLISGIWVPDSCDCHVFGYSIMTRMSSDTSGSARRDVIADVMANEFFPGPENYIGQYYFSSQTSEYWGGLSYAYRFNDRFSIGATTFLAIRDQSASENILARAVNPVVAAATDGSASYDFYNGRLLWKVGMAADLEPVKLGFTLTTPSISLFGDGDSARDISVINQDLDGDGFVNSIVADDRQESLDAEIRSPMSIAAGIEWTVTEGTALAASVEWFTRLGRYDVLEPSSNDFVRPPGIFPGLFDSQDFLGVTDAAQPVFNFAVGLEQRLTEKVKGIVSFRSDYSNAEFDDSVKANLGLGDWNIYHATAGALWKLEKSEFALGVTYSFGDADDVSQVANFNDANESNLLLGEPGLSSVDYDAVSVILGYTYFF